MRKLYGPEISGPGILNYHSSREERVERSPWLKALHCERDKVRSRGLFSRLFGGSRAARLTFLNIIALVFLLAFYNIVTSRITPESWTQGGFRFTLSAFAREDRVLTSLRVTKEKDAAWTGSVPEITLGSDSETESLAITLPLVKGETTYIRTIFTLPESGQIFCEVNFGNKTRRLTVSLKE